MTRIADLLAAGRTLSFELFPPKTDEAERQLEKCVVELAELEPSFVSVTYGALGSTRERTRDVVTRINAEQAFPAMPHLTCVGHRREELVDIVTGIVDRLIVDHPHAAPAPFMGPVIDNIAADQLQEAFLELMGKGGRAIRRLDRKTDERPFLTPALIDVTEVERRPDAELFGPVLQIVRVDTYDEAVELVNANPYGNGTAIFTNDGGAARRFEYEVEVGMVGVNVPIPVPIAYYTFGGWKRSGFGDLNQHGPDAFRFYTKTKTVTSRWPSGVKEGAQFAFHSK